MKVNHRAVLLVGAVGLTVCASHPARADEKGERILRQAFQKLYAARTYSGDFSKMESKGTGLLTSPIQGHFQARKPNLLRAEVNYTYKKQMYKELLVSNGKSICRLYNSTYYREKVGAKLDAFDGRWDEEVNAFFGGVQNAIRLTAEYAGTEQVGDSFCDLVRTRRKDNSDPRVLTYAIGQQDHLIHQVVTQDDTETITTETVSSLHLDTPLDDKLFVFVPPKGAKEDNTTAEDLDAPLVPVGQEAPAFEVTDPATLSRFSLAQVLNKKQVVLINFWMYF